MPYYLYGKLNEKGVKMNTKADTGAHKIIFMSRLDEDCSLGAHLLCDIAPALARKLGKIEIFIIGGGAEYKKILKCAKRINRDFEYFATEKREEDVFGGEKIGQEQCLHCHD